MQKVSVVILNFNGKHFLEQFLPSVIQNSEGHEIVVADNCSTDDSITFLKAMYPELRIIRLAENFGFCKGYNEALKEIDSEYYVILNSDVEVTPGWIDPVVDLLDNNPDIAAVQPKLLDHNKKDYFEYAGGAGGFMDMFGYPFCRGRLFEDLEEDEGQYDDTCEIFWATGACLFVRTKLFHQFGGFDEDFFAHMEEIDLCWRFKHAGNRIFYTSASTVYHVGGGTLSKANPKKTYYNFRNGMVLLLKNLPPEELWWKVPVRWIIDYVAVMKFFLTGEIANGRMVLKAHLNVVRHLRRHMKKRNKYAQFKNKLTGTYNKFLLFQYHIAKVRKFKKLKF
jgi:GT2 family glycosyltransferase